MTTASEARFDLRDIPFSSWGSWFNLSPVVALHDHTDDVHLVSHRNGMHAVLRLVPERAGRPVPTRWQADPSRFAWCENGIGVVEAAYDGPGALRLRGSGALALRLGDAAGGLTPFTGSYLYREPVDDSAVFTSYETGHRYRITTLSGAMDVVGDQALGRSERAVVLGADGAPWEAVLQETTCSADPYRAQADFDAVVAAAAEAFATYLDALAPWRDDRTPAAARAAYVMWSATVGPAGFTTRTSVLMSKHWMDKLWSWDHCFNALALAPGLTDAAVDQFLAPFDHQDATGALPDSITHSEVLYNYVKPPIHGWALRRLRESAGRALTPAELERAYDGLCRWTDFWLTRRRAPGHVLPYYQHGNDSGWDNATTFDHDRVVESPDLAAFLVLQLDAVAGLGVELGHPVDRWIAERDRVLQALLDQLWTADGFVAVGVASGRTSPTTSLLTTLPIVLADRLPPAVRDHLVAAVAQHLTKHGLATEPVDSPQYEDDGYWRGPIWAPSTALIEDGLRHAGAVELADVVSARFRELCERSGFAENFNARTGDGLRDRAYTWTAAVYLTLAAEHVRRGR